MSSSNWLLRGGSAKLGHFLDFCWSTSGTRVSVELSITDLLSSRGVVLEALIGCAEKVLNGELGSRQPEDSSEELLDFRLYSGHTSGVDSFDPF